MLQLYKINLHILIFLVFTGCSGNGDASVEFHPIEERIPYWNSDIQTQIVQKETGGSTSIHISDQDFTFPLLFSEIIEISSHQSVDLPFTSEENILFRSINMDRIIMFDVFRQSLFEYQISTNSWNLIAESGPGPGELSFVQDIIIQNDTLYAISQDSRIERFDCHNKICQYASSINLAENIQPVSLDRTEDGFITLGSKISAREGVTTEIETESLFEFGQAGELKRSEGKLYETNGHWMLHQPFGQGKVRSLSGSGGLIYFFEFFPLVYHLDNDYKFIKKVKLSDFTLAKQQYHPDTGELWVPQEDYSRIEDVVFINEKLFLLSIVHQKDFKIVDQFVDWTKIKDFYIVDLTEINSQYIGSVDDSLDADIHFTKHHIIMLERDKYKIETYNLF